MSKNENAAAEIETEAAAEIETEATAEVKPKTPAEMEAYLNEYVSVKLFRDNDKYKDPVYVAVNGQNCVIRRGEWVKVKRKFALVLDQSEVQDLRTAEMMEAESSRYTAESRALGF